MHPLKRRRGTGRPVKIDALRCREQFDANDPRGIVHHAQQPARRVRGHADMILLVCRGRDRVDAARRSDGFIFGDQCGGRDLRDHEAGVQAAVLDQKGRQPAHLRVNEDCNAPLREAADLGDREGEGVCRKGHWLGVKVAAGEHVAAIGEQQGIVGNGIGLEVQRRRDIADQIEASAHDLRLAAKGIRVLHAGAIDMRGPDGAAVHQLEVLAGDCDLARLAAGAVDARIEGRIAALQCIDRHCTGDYRAREQIFRAKQPGQRERRGDLGAIDQGETFLGAQLERLQAGLLQSLRRIEDVAVDAYLADPQQHRPQVRERRKIARGADRTLGGDHRIHLPVQQREQPVDQLIADAGQALGERIDLQCQDQADDSVGQGLTDPRGMRHQQVSLQEFQLVVGDAGLGQQPKPGIDAIGSRAALDDAIHQLAGARDAQAIGLGERQVHRLRVDLSQVGQR